MNYQSHQSLNSQGRKIRRYLWILVYGMVPPLCSFLLDVSSTLPAPLLSSPIFCYSSFLFVLRLDDCRLATQVQVTNRRRSYDYRDLEFLVPQSTRIWKSMDTRQV